MAQESEAVARVGHEDNARSTPSPEFHRLILRFLLSQPILTTKYHHGKPESKNPPTITAPLPYTIMNKPRTGLIYARIGLAELSALLAKRGRGCACPVIS